MEQSVSTIVLFMITIIVTVLREKYYFGLRTFVNITRTNLASLDYCLGKKKGSAVLYNQCIYTTQSSEL